MQICKTIEELSAVADNTVIGAENLTLQGSDIRFGGTGNVLFVDMLEKSRFNIQKKQVNDDINERER